MASALPLRQSVTIVILARMSLDWFHIGRYIASEVYKLCRSPGGGQESCEQKPVIRIGVMYEDI